MSNKEVKEVKKVETSATGKKVLFGTINENRLKKGEKPYKAPFKMAYEGSKQYEELSKDNKLEIVKGGL
jgi:hypothetical protein